MPDYGQDLRFGVFPAPDADRLTQTLELAQLADRAGLDLIGVQDHPYQRRHLDTWALMATLLARTERVRVFPDVANLPLRPPAVLAKAAASLDLLSGGRFELGLGAGGFWTAVDAMGGPARTPGEAAAALREAVDVVRLMWSGERSVRYDGRHYRLAGVKPGPAPAHPIGVWLGVYGPRLLEFTGRAADGWVPSSAYVPPERLGEMSDRIDTAAREAGRDPAAVRRVYNVMGEITASGGGPGSFLHGPPERWIDELTALALDHGMDTFVFAPPGDDPAQVEVFAAEVAPAVRDGVARHRGSASG
ncbi:LLM class flavin-dependent oxidoreductase [Streptomonospora nanhaiensis]|uniref:LLM class flavin-dependent oxidoreductase n=1 Tax=Streptomonospora nanhaiensis TaxID=1323731 RepID=UPI001C392A63|nr:LLM class flavin-dependent oxidoreductase [Streptomonospora nanhaiensis]MBV2365266.1 LLM class flavin-dependent oxidoreductase [Streptomonospora nanhaiensis]MBX9390309.1 LLM class flavin-dependent oxidoreductase [Streptomonospora nanhaiensis]